MYGVKPIVFDLFCGLGGWSEAFIDAGYRAIGFDIEAHDYGNGGYPGELVLRDIRSITGAELVQAYGVPAVIAASPPCQEFSYMAMPWSRSKQIMAALLGGGRIKGKPGNLTVETFPEGYKGSRTIEELTRLFNECFRIQREVSAAAGHYVPLIIENVRGAQEWVGKARWNFGSFYLWGDVPALMPILGKLAKVPTMGAGWYPPGHPKHVAGLAFNGHAERNLKSEEGRKLHGNNGPMRRNSSKSSARKRASAEIAKIPKPLAAWIARVFKPATKP